MKNNRLERLNSLLREIIYEVIHREVKHPLLQPFVITVNKVDTAADLSHAKVYISISKRVQNPDKSATPQMAKAEASAKAEAFAALESAAGFIQVHASKKADLRYFPNLTFKLDKGLEEQIRVEELLAKIEQQRLARPPETTDEE